MDLPISQFLNFNRPPNGSYGQQQASLEEFPSLSKMSLVSQMQASSRANYVNIAKDNQSTTSDNAQSEFTIKDWDFPALPGSQNNPNVSIIGTKAGGGSTTGNKSSSSTPLNNQTTITSGSSSASSSNGGANNGPQSAANGGAANAHEIGTTAAIDQCGNRDKPFFSPIVSQKSMWLNGAVERSSILGSSPASTSFLDQRKLEEQQQATLSFLEQQQQHQQQHQQQQQQQLQQQQQRLQQQQQQQKQKQQQQQEVTDDISINGGSCGATLTSNSGGGLNNKGSAEQFGMFGLLCFLNFAEKSPNLASVTFGTDLTALGLNLTATEKLYPSFAGPWSDRTLNVHEIDYPVPPEYLISGSIRDKLQIQLKRYHEDTIFFLFYLYPNDLFQLAAADELYSRDWRYHKEQRAWLTRMPGSRVEKTETHERGTYFIFDHIQWKRISKELTIDYNKLEGQPSI